MPTPEQFAGLGLFVREAVLDSETCARICAEMAGAPASEAPVMRSGERAVEPTVRQTLDVLVTPETRRRIEQMLDALAPALAGHFGGALVRTEAIHFLRYRAGHFFAPHQDTDSAPGTTHVIHARQVSVVLFLNGWAKEPIAGQFSGGALKLFGLVTAPGFAQMALPFHAQPGMLVAFPSTLVHAVEAVTAGERLSVVAWFRRG